MTTEQLIQQIHRKQSFLCIGLDVDLDKVPKHLLEEDDPVFAFNKAIIDSTHEFCVAYKPNIAFYETYGEKGWRSLEKTIRYLNANHPDIFTIADAKRGDIGNTSSRYARAFFEDLEFDSVTVAPYMGRDSVEPFLSFEGKHTILLALTSNSGAEDFQTKLVDGQGLFKRVIETSLTWNNSKNLMYVVGATQAECLSEIRRIVPDKFLLIPGVGVQGGNLEQVCQYGLNEHIGLLVNSSRGIIYASDDYDFAIAASKKAKEMQQEMSGIMANKFN
jgi:orotidine-5'-phosphate decarboxylase